MLRSGTTVGALSRLSRPPRPLRPKIDRPVDLGRLSSTATPAAGGAGGAPPKGGSGGAKLLVALFGTAALATGTIVYAKSDPDVRELVKDYLPWLDETIAVVYGEKETPISRAVSTVTDLFPSSSEPAKPAPKQEIAPAKPAIKPSSSKKDDVFAPIAPPKPKARDEEKPKPVIIEKAILEDAVGLDKASDALVKAYKRANETLKAYAKKVDAVMTSTLDEVDHKYLEELRSLYARNDEAEKEIRTATKRLEEVLGGGMGPKAEQIRSEIRRLKEEYEKANANTSVTQRYWNQVEQARQYFIDELQAIFPDSNIKDKKLDLKGGNADSLLLLALRRVFLYQQMLANNETLLNKRVDQALLGSEEDVVKAKIELELDKQQRELALMYQKKEAIAEANAKRVLEAELRKQLDIHTSHLNEALERRAKEAVVDEKRAAEERAETQRIQHELKLAAILGRLQGVDDALKAIDDDLKARSDADKMARQSQRLWAACEALESALRQDTYQPISLSKEIDSIASVAADSDELVSTVLRCVPKAIKERGVYSELALKEKYNHVENACRRTALVPEEGGGLPVHFLSWLQSVFIIKSRTIPKDELNNQPMDFSELDTYEILQRIGYWVDRNDWAQALRYSRLLKGAPKSVIQDWANEVTLHLEARQAAKVLLAHASASGLLYF